jgi:cytochrome c553
MSLVSYADLMAPSPSDPSISNAQAALQRMQDPMSPMPPSPLSLSAAEIQTFQTWVNTGMPQADCSAPPAPPPNIYDTPVTCSSGTHWTQGTNGSAAMKPGGACINCHTKSGGGGEDEAPRLTLGGTVYRTAHEPDDCNGTQVNTGDPPGSGMDPLEVQIFDPNGNPSVPVLTIQVNGAGNFSSQSPIPNPFTAAVVDTVTQDARVMALPQKSGDCNGCHTVSGINTVAGAPKAPGRIMAP